MLKSVQFIFDVNGINGGLKNTFHVKQPSSSSAATRKHTMVGQKYFKGEKTSVWGAKNIIK